MAHSRDNPSSPRSSCGGAESFKGTPETRLTAFSPDDGTKSFKMSKDVTASNSTTPARPALVTYQSIDKDPFVTPARSHPTGLSPTALVFNPFAGPAGLPISEGSVPVSTALSTELGLSRHLRVSSHVPLSTGDVQSWLTVSKPSTLYTVATNIIIETGAGIQWRY